MASRFRPTACILLGMRAALVSVVVLPSLVACGDADPPPGVAISPAASSSAPGVESPAPVADAAPEPVASIVASSPPIETVASAPVDAGPLLATTETTVATTGAKKARPVVVRSAPASGGPPAGKCAEPTFLAAIHPSGATGGDVDASILSCMGAAPSALAKDATIVEAKRRDGRDARAFSRVRAGGVAARLGFQKGDVVTSVDGVDVTDQLGMFALYASASTHRTHKVHVERGPSDVDLAWRVR